MCIRVICTGASLLITFNIYAQSTPPVTPKPPTTPPSTVAPKVTPPVAPSLGGKTSRPVSPSLGGPADPPLAPPFYSRPDVTRSLELTDRQLGQLNTMTQTVQSRFQDRFGQLRDMTEAQRAARALELNRAFATDWMAGARDVFNEAQLNRYQQLQLQYGGFSSFTSPDVQRRLQLTDLQIKALPDSIKWNDAEMRGVLAAPDQVLANKLYGDYLQEAQERLAQWLTPEQMRTWKDMTGSRFEFLPILSPAPPPKQ
jgi:hypothetical protein